MTVTTMTTYDADLDRQLGDVKGHVRTAAEAIAGRFGLSTMSGWRAQGSVPNSDHPKGLAIDIPVSKGTGDAVAAWVIDNAGTLGVSYVIWQQRIWKRGDTDWTAMAHRDGDRPGYDPNHLRHVHVSFGATAPEAGPLQRLRDGVGGVVGGIGSAISGAVGGVSGAVEGITSWPQQVMTIGLKLAVAGTGLVLLILGAQQLVSGAGGGALNQLSEVVK